MTNTPPPTAGPFTLPQLLTICQDRRLDADVELRTGEWMLEARTADGATINLTGYRDALLEESEATLEIAGHEYDLSLDEAVAMLTGAVDVRRWADDMEQAAQLLADAEEYRSGHYRDDRLDQEF